MAKTILVAGDATRWVHLLGEGRRARHSPGGLQIIKDLIALWCGDGAAVAGSSNSAAIPAEYIEWKLFGRTWRPSARVGADETSAELGTFDQPTAAKPDVLVVVDSGRSFVDDPDLWPAALRQGGSPGHVILVAHTLAAQAGELGDAFSKRMKELRDRLTVIVSADLLRRRGSAISCGLSWDRTIEETAREMTEGLSAADLAFNQRTIITFGLSGAAVFTGREMEHFLYDPAHLEGFWEPERTGIPLLTELAATAAGARHALNPTDNPLFIALKDALNFASAVHEGGECPDIDSLAAWNKLATDSLTTSKAPGKGKRNFFSTFPHGILSDPTFSRQPSTQSDLLRDGTGATLEYVEAKATEVVIFGTRVLDAVPSARFAKFFTVDRDEIEGLQTIRRQVESYRANMKIDRPLSLAVFGQPGSGKSFAIKQLAKEMLGDLAQVFEFNLTQFQKWEDLVLSFHRIRDAAARGLMPFVFWDEFDTDDFRWLKHFLAPMQDAEFHSAGHAFPFGRGVFVFAGGVAHTMAEFRDKVGRETARKGPDFISRLHGSLDVKGPNPARVGGSGGTTQDAKPEDDTAYLIRRAIMLRIGIERFQTQILDSSGTAAISPGVVRAFLRVRKFEHGARSLEALVSQSRASSSFEASDLPPNAVLRLHVDESFEEQRRLGLLGTPVLEALAKACHDAWWKQKRERFRPDSEEAKAHERLKDYTTAPKKYVDSSRKTARVTEAKLASLGLRIVRKGAGDPASLGETEISRLVEIEHDIWLRDYLQKGYERAAETRDILCQHRCICQFNELSKADQSLDLAIACSVETTLSDLGYQLAKEGQGSQEDSGARS